MAGLVVQASHRTRDLPEGWGAEIQPMLLSLSPASWQGAVDHQRGHFPAIRITVLDRLMILWKTLLKKNKSPLGSPAVDPLNQSTQHGPAFAESSLGSFNTHPS